MTFPDTDLAILKYRNPRPKCKRRKRQVIEATTFGDLDHVKIYKPEFVQCPENLLAIDRTRAAPKV